MPVIERMSIPCALFCGSGLSRSWKWKTAGILPGTTYFRVRADDGNFYILRHEEPMDVWTLDAFRTSREYEITAQPLDVTTPPGPHGAS